MEWTVTTAHIDEYVEILRKRALQYRLAQLGDRLADADDLDAALAAVDAIEAERCGKPGVKITTKGGANGKLFGAITGKEISEALMAQFGLDVGKQKIVLDEPIKAFGSYEIRAKLGYEVSGKFTVTVAEE